MPSVAVCILTHRQVVERERAARLEQNAPGDVLAVLSLLVTYSMPVIGRYGDVRKYGSLCGKDLNQHDI